MNFIAQTITRKIELETADAASPDRPFNDVKLRKLREMLDEARRKPCRVIVFFQANHALMHAEAGHIGTSVIPFEKERRALVTMIAASNAAIPGAPPIELWDFCNYHPLSCEPIPLDNPKEGRMKDWADLGHFTVVDEDDGTATIELTRSLVAEVLNPSELRLTVVAVAFDRIRSSRSSG